MNRSFEIVRKTRETDIEVFIDLDGEGNSLAATGIGFFDHMLTHISKHGLMNLRVKASGDLEVDYHHTVEDVGIVFGQALAKALGDKVGIERFGSSFVPMDETLAHVVMDISGRPHLSWDVPMPKAKVGEFDVELAEEFFRAVVYNAGLTLHIRLLAGTNLHHILEAVFKAFGRALREAISTNPRVVGVPSTKGML